MAKRAATIGDVARVSGVSRATASRALNDSPLVTPETKQRVRNAATELGFVKNALGQQLATGRSETIAVLATEPLDELFADPTYARVLRGITEGLSASRYLPILLQAWSASEHERAVRHFERRAVDAVISISPYVGGDLLESLAQGPLPVVLCGQLGGDPYEGVFSSVYADDVVGAALAASHLLGLGRRRIAVIDGPQDNPAAVDRRRGYREALGEAYAPGLVTATAWDQTAGFDAMLGLLDVDPGIDGVLAASDRIAVGALSALEMRRRRVPQDVAVVGFDDHELAATARPPLTTMRQPMLEQGRLAAELALGMLDGWPPQTIVLDTELVLRRSA